MGKRGPKPTPTAQLRLRGSWRAGLRDGEPEPKTADQPKPPKWFSPRARAIWRDAARVLSSMHVLTEADINALSRYCRLFERWEKDEQFLSEKGENWVKKDDDGTVQSIEEFPQVARSARIAEQLLRLEREFGMTPSSRTAIKVDSGSGQEAETKKKNFFQG